MTEPTDLTFKDYDTLLNDMITTFASKNTGITDFNKGSVIRSIFEAVAQKLEESHYLAEQEVDLFFVTTSRGKYLASRAGDYGISGGDGSKANGHVTGSRTTPAPYSQLIPVGTTFATIDRAVTIVTTADMTMYQGEISIHIPVAAAAVGKSGNLVAGTVLKQSGVAVSLLESITVASPGLTGGADADGDDELRSETLTTMRQPGTSGNKADYIKWALEVEGVGDAYPEPLADGPGTVKLYLLGEDKTPASQSVVDAVQTYIDPIPGTGDGQAPVGAIVTCVIAPAVTINITATAIIAESVSISEVTAAYQEDVRDYLASTAFSKQDTTVRYSKLASILSAVDGVNDYSDLLINDGTSNITIPAGSVPVLGSVVLT